MPDIRERFERNTTGPVELGSRPDHIPDTSREIDIRLPFMPGLPNGFADDEGQLSRAHSGAREQAKAIRVIMQSVRAWPRSWARAGGLAARSRRRKCHRRSGHSIGRLSKAALALPLSSHASYSCKCAGGRLPAIAGTNSAGTTTTWKSGSREFPCEAWR